MREKDGRREDYKRGCSGIKIEWRMDTKSCKGKSLADYNYSLTTAAAFGGVAGVFAIQFFSEVPKVKTDIVQVRLSPTF